jgi:hypothetical protein
MSESTPMDPLEALPEHLRDALRPHALLAPADGEPCRAFVGFCAPIVAPGGDVRVRIYLTVGLREAIEVDVREVLYAQRLGRAGSLDASVVWLAADAQVTRVERAGADAAMLLRGEISGEYLAHFARADREGPHPTLEAAPASPSLRLGARPGEIRPTYDCG